MQTAINRDGRTNRQKPIKKYRDGPISNKKACRHRQTERYKEQGKRPRKHKHTYTLAETSLNPVLTLTPYKRGVILIRFTYVCIMLTGQMPRPSLISCRNNTVV